MEKFKRSLYANISIYAREHLTRAVVFVLIATPLFCDGAGPAGDRVEALVHKLADKNEFVRRNAIGTLVELRDARAVDPLLGALHDPSRMVRAQAAEGLGNLKAKAAVHDLTLLLEKDPSAQVRQAAALALSFISDSAAIPALVACVNGRDSELRPSCADALGVLKASEAVSPLSALITNRDVGLQVAAITALGRIKTVDAYDAVRKVLEASSGGRNTAETRAVLNPAVEEAAINALASMAKPEAASLIQRSLKAPDDRIRSASCMALAQLGDSSGLTVCVGLLGHPDVSIRRNVAQALGTIGTAETLKVVQQAQKTEKDPIVLQNLKAAAAKIQESGNTRIKK